MPVRVVVLVVDPYRDQNFNMTFFVTDNDAHRISQIVTVELDADLDSDQPCEVTLNDGISWWLSHADGVRLLELLRMI